ncbi:hypothetical protein QQ045_004265 [Rhodiola kirilowii]
MRIIVTTLHNRSTNGADQQGMRVLALLDDEYHLNGTFTDGDLRRTLKANKRRHFQTHCQ